MKKLALHNPSYQYLEAAFTEWLDILGYAPSTRYNLPNHIRELLHYLENNNIQHIRQLNIQHIQEHYRQLQQRHNQRQGGALSKGSLNKQIQALYKFAEYLRQSSKHHLPHLNIDWEKDDTQHIETLSQTEIQQLYKATQGYNQGTQLEPLNSRDRAILSIFYGCGLRRNEGYHLNLTDLNFDHQTLHVRKGKNYKERIVPFNKSIAQYLQEYIYDYRPQLLKNTKSEALLISQKGQRLAGQSIALRLKILQQRTDDPILQNKNIRLHVLRHSIATHLLQNGMSVEKIAQFLGHNSLESTQIYTHLVDKDSDIPTSIPKHQSSRTTSPYPNIPAYSIIQLHEDEE